MTPMHEAFKAAAARTDCRQRRRLLLQALSLGAMALPGGASAMRGGTDLKALDAKLAALVHDSERPLAGLSVLLIKDGQTVFESQWGARRLALVPDQAALPVDEQTMFRVASVSKLTVAMAAMKLVEQGRLDLDADIGHYLAIPLRHPVHPKIPLTARLLLTHRSSLSDQAGYAFATPQAFQSALRSNSAWSKHAPGRYFAYANLNLGVLGCVMEAASGQRFDRLMRELLFEPLGMQASFNVADFAPAQINNLATLYAKRLDTATGERWTPQGAWVAKADDFRGRAQTEVTALSSYALASNASLMSPQGGLRISVRDLALLMQIFLNQGIPNGSALLKPASVAQMLQPHWRLDASHQNGDDMHGLFNAWALGLQQFTDHSDARAVGHGDRLIQRGGLQAFGHLGDAYGLLSGFIFNPEQKWGVIYVINGVSDNPDRFLGSYSSFSRWEETLLNELLSALPTL
jgi:CubicO group peptidase (beta-lactamase class C family)